MQKLNFPDYEFKIKNSGKSTQIFDEVRKKYVSLTPEEWVRQHLVRFLIEEKKFPSSLIAIEMGLKYNRLIKRGDIVVYSQNRIPVLIVECKAPSVKISQNAFDQIARYNFQIKVKYLVVSNGLDHYCCCLDDDLKAYTFIREIPSFNEIV